MENEGSSHNRLSGLWYLKAINERKKKKKIVYNKLKKKRLISKKSKNFLIQIYRDWGGCSLGCINGIKGQMEHHCILNMKLHSIKWTNIIQRKKIKELNIELPFCTT
jgi:hypothetical protein